MAKGLNKVVLLGYVGAEPEVRQLSGGKTVVNIRIATTEAWRDKVSNQLQEKTEWHRVVLFGGLAEVAASLLGKGSLLYVEGYLKNNKWEDKLGILRYTTEIVANEMNVLSSRSEKPIDSQFEKAAGQGGGEDYPDVLFNMSDKDVPF